MNKTTFKHKYNIGDIIWFVSSNYGGNMIMMKITAVAYIKYDTQGEKGAITSYWIEDPKNSSRIGTFNEGDENIFDTEKEADKYVEKQLNK